MSFQLAHLDGARIPRTVEKKLAAASAFTEGAPLVVDGNGDYAECGANPTSVAAIALSACGADSSGFNPTGRKEFPQGYMQGVTVQNERTFHAAFEGTLPSKPGGEYGIKKGADGIWRVNFADTTNKVVRLVSLGWTAEPIAKQRVLVLFIPTVVQAL